MISFDISDEELARRFEQFEPDDAAVHVTPLGELYEAVRARAVAERLVGERVRAARAGGSSWAAIGMMLGTSGEAARQRYGRLVGRRDDATQS